MIFVAGRIIACLLFFMAFMTSTKCFSQCDTVIKEVKYLTIAKNWATLKDYSYSNILSISKDSLKHDLEIKLWDSTYNIKYFRFAHLGEECGFIVRTIVGNTIKIAENKILNYLANGDLLEISTFKIEKAGKYYTLPGFAVFVTD